jgi:hypothetical protein
VEPLDDAVVERDVAVLEESTERGPVIREVAERCAERRRRQLVFLAHFAPVHQLVPYGTRPRTALDELCVWIEVPDLSFDLVELAIAGDSERGALVSCVKRLHEVAARVHVAAALDQLRSPEARIEEVRRVGDGGPIAKPEHVLGTEFVRLLAGSASVEIERSSPRR